MIRKSKISWAASKVDQSYEERKREFYLKDDEEKKKIEELKLAIAIEREKIESDLKKLSDLEKTYQTQLGYFQASDPTQAGAQKDAAAVDFSSRRQIQELRKELKERQEVPMLWREAKNRVVSRDNSRSSRPCSEQTQNPTCRPPASPNQRQELLEPNPS